MCRLALAVLCLAGAVILGAAPVRGDDDDDEEGRIEELFFAETPYSQERREIQLMLRSSLLDFPDQQDIDLSLSAEYGITDAFQIGIEVPYRFLRLDGEDDENGIGDVELEALYRFTDADDPFIASLALGVSLPTGSEKRELGEGSVEAEPLLLLGAHFGPAALYGNVGASLGKESAFLYAVAAAYARGPLIGLVEIAGEHGGGEDEVYLTPGLAWQMWERAQLQFGVPIGLTGDAADWGAILHLVVEFE